VNYLNDESNKIIISTGPAGTGKTLFACQKAITQLKSQEIDKIILTRPVVTVEEEIGFLPGNIIKKMDPWTKPIFDIFLEYCSKTELDLMLHNGKIEICPLAFMRGRTFKSSFIIADEMQNSSPNQMKMLVTRLGKNSRMVITGDLQQTDIQKENGLYDFITRLEKHNNSSSMIKLVKLENEDIERSEVVKKVIEIYNYKHNNSNNHNISNIAVVDMRKSVNTSSIIKNNSTIENIKNSTIIENIKNITTIENIKNVTNATNGKNATVDKIKKNEQVSSDDAAMIPKRFISRNYDIYFESRDF
jgi:phosphate starvation-inducible PhoH-like protein